MIRLATLAETQALGERLGALVRAGDVVTLSGGLGAGKTSLARGMLRALGLVHEAPSPSFAIVQPYDPPETALPVLHVDLYRIEDSDEMAELGIDEADDAVLIVEWPERACPGYWPQALAIHIQIESDGTRCLTAQVPAAWKGRWPFP